MGCASAKHHAERKVVITGITGYLGSQVCQALLQDTGFSQVRGTMRNPKDTEKLEKLKKAYGAKVFGRLEIVAADLLDAESLDKAIEGQDVVVHVASPIPVVAPADENELIRPAVEGTLAILRAAQKHKVKRVVITSSGLSIFVQKPDNFKPTFTEDDFSDVSVMDGYAKSKLLAE